MKRLLLGLSLIASVSVSHSMMEEEEFVSFDVPVQSFKSYESSYVSPDIIPTESLRVVAMQTTGFTGEKGDKLQDAFLALEAVVNSEEFKERVINFKNKKGQRSFGSNRGYTNEEIYQIFMEGRETLQPNTPNEMNFWLKLYNRPWSKVIGYTSANTNVININWKYFRTNTTNNVAANLAHEWVHKLGFTHSSASEHDSAPYAIGYIVGDLVKARLTRGLH